MSKTLKKKKHWASKVQEHAVSWGGGEELSSVLEILGGAEHGEFPHVGHGSTSPSSTALLRWHAGRSPSPGDVLLEVNGTPVSGLTHRDTLAVIRHFREPVRLKTVKPGKVLNTDLRHYLSLQFQKGSLDHKLQQVIRDNLYLRTIPCNYYGTPKPPAEPSPVQPDLVDQVLFDEDFENEVQRKRTTSVSKMERMDSTAPEEEDEEERPALVNGLTEHKEVGDWRKTVPSYTQPGSAMDLGAWSMLPGDESQETLPRNWEMAYTETGMVYFIDHNTKTTTWLDPRLARKSKPVEKFDEEELPYGWEKIDDPQYGTYYVDHINQKTQFENPLMDTRQKHNPEAAIASQPGLIPSEEGSLRGFTRDPSQLKGTMLRTALRKSTQGFGFTIIGGDRPDEFLQVKNVLKDGPAAQDNKIAPGDVIVDINGDCVLGKTHADVVQMFQSVAVNQYVDMVLCRGYPLPEDTGGEAAGDSAAAPPPDRQTLVPDGRQEDAPELTMLQPELVSTTLAKGPNGFGFAIADCPLGQKVKMILDAQWCRGLLKGDVIKEINRKNVQTLSHTQVVDILKELPVGSEVNVLVLRGGQTSPVKSLKPCATAMPMPVNQKHETSTNPVSTDSPSPVEPLPQALPQTLPQALPQAPPQSLPFPPNVVRSSSPKLDPSEVYLKSRAMLDSKPANTRELDVFIKRNQESGFGFRVLGGEGTDQPVYIGAIVPLGAAEKDGRLRAGDELLCIDGVPVKGKSHKQVLELMTNAARNGQVMLTVRRKLIYTEGREDDDGQSQAAPPLVNGSPRPSRADAPVASQPEPYDVTLQRKDNEGFGFVILTSKNKPPPGVIPHKIGRIIKGSPTERSGKLKVGDRISAVNGQCIMELSHNEIVQLIKQAGNTVTLTVLPEEEHSGPASATSSAKQSPVSQHKAMGQQPASRNDCNGTETEGKEDGVVWSNYKSLPKNESGTVCNSGPKQVGDQIVEINGEPTQGITHTRAIELIQAGGTKVLLLLRPGQGLIPDHNVMEIVTTPSANYPKYPVRDEPSLLPSQSSPSLLPSEGTSAPSFSRGLQHQSREHRTSSSSVSLRDNTPSPQKLDSSRTEGKERSLSPRKMDKKPQSLDVYTDRKAEEQRDRGGRSASSRKSPRKEQETSTRQPAKGYDESHRYSDGFNYRPGGNPYKEEDLDLQQDKETGEIRPEITRSDNIQRHREKGGLREAAPQKPYSQIPNDRTMSELQPTTWNHKGHREPIEGRYRGGTGEESKRDLRGSSSVPPETSWNGNPSNKKSPITPGPWKVPSSAKMQSQVEGL
ncbi:Membrane-associated guanylate kinase, WW and PDZ domain-containing protein 3 [Bagarius yarrelli]|uniref:Membrane-associated guanylate kinase, WW and PDZ domain-containing protein 3 n=1 Tax=Bagarius yarrelli TaxID=175774 RepID=A0A556U0G3_BAGYA|nr:Membrane-associated guanylate kinase, WW and PDZ domain-containing protein 3 [Bagarius yarrelli]